VAVLGYGAWQRHFGGDTEIVGKSVLLDDQAYSIVGVMPADFGHFLPRRHGKFADPALGVQPPSCADGRNCG